jgi:outer membrane protein TolC
LHAASALVGVAIANRIPLFNLTGNAGRSGSQFDNLFNPAPPFQFWTLAGSVTQTIFDGFTLEQRQRAAEAGWEQAAEQYQSTVVTAFQNVADVLQAIEFDARSLVMAKSAAKAATQNLCLTVAGFVGYDGEGKPEDHTHLHAIKGAPQLREGIAQRFGRWWRSVCRGERDVIGKLSGEYRKSLSDPDKGSSPGPSGIDVLTSEQLYLTTRLSVVTARATQYMDVVALFQALGGGWWNRSQCQGKPESRLAC